MSSSEIPHVEFYVKEEAFINYVEEEWIPEPHDIKEELKLESKQITFVEDTAKCGEVMVGHQGKFTFICILCMKHFNELDLFGCHIRDRHINDFSESPSENIGSGDQLDKPESTNSVRTQSENDENHDCEVDNSSDPMNQDRVNESFMSDDSTGLAKFVIGNKKSALKKNFFCGYCGRSYTSTQSYRKHLKKMHPSCKNALESNKGNARIPDEIVCKYCYKKFNDAVEYKKHTRSHTERNRFVCPYCPKVFPNRSNRQAHINVHTGERPHKCTHCSKAFAATTNLARHKRQVHLKIMKFSCNYCDKRFVQSQDKKVHERTHIGEKPFQCQECDKRYKLRFRLIEHIKRHKKIKNHVCTVCNKRFYDSGELKEHSRIHTDVRPFHCNACGQNFRRRDTLKAHQNLHSKEKKYVCDVCGKAFAQVAGLYRHRKTHREK